MKFPEFLSPYLSKIPFLSGKRIFQENLESQFLDFQDDMEYRVDKSFSYMVFYFHFLFYFILLFIPSEMVPLVFLNHVGITIFASLIALFAKYDIIFAHVLNTLLGMIHILVFVTIGQLQFLSNGSLTVEYMNNFYLSLPLLILFHSLRISQFSCIVPGITFMILHFVSLLYLSEYSEDFLSLIAFFPQAVYLVSTVIGTILIHIRRRDIENISRLNSERNTISNELRIAKRVQDTLFPRDIKIDGLQFEVFRQNYNYLGGDFYDFVQLREGNVGIFLTDVAGHGISSAMVASIMKVMVATIPYKLKLNPAKLLGFLDYHLERNLDQYHASAIYLFIDFQKRKITLGNAGHPYLIYCPAGAQFREITTSGAILGFRIRDPIVDNLEIDFNLGDRFFIYTDGLIESKTEKGKTISEEDLIQILNKRKDVKNLSIMKELIIEDIYRDHHLRTFSDDTMFLLFEIEEKKL